MLIESPEVEAELQRLADEVANMAGETRADAVRRALEERRARLVTERDASHVPTGDPHARLAAWRELQQSVALTPEAAEAWVAELRAERKAHRILGDVE